MIRPPRYDIAFAEAADIEEAYEEGDPKRVSLLDRLDSGDV